MDATTLKKTAIEAALSGDWEAAVEANLRILEQESEEIDALNRLGRAYFEMGKRSLAAKTWRKVLTLDQYNPIAKKNLARLTTPSKATKAKAKQARATEIFLEEPGKTRTVSLKKVAEAKILSGVDSGDEVVLKPRKRGISVFSEDNIYLGTLPDDLAARLIPFLRGGNRYQAFVKSVGEKRLDIFIRETFRSRRFADKPSFVPSNRDYLISTPKGVIEEEELELAPTGEEEEEES